MKCQQCQTENPKQAKFCIDCGTKMERKCNACGSEYSEQAKFCIECGTKVGEAQPAALPKEATKPQTAERRQLTVLFCDLVGSTAISDQMDAEDFRQVILDYQQVAQKVVLRYGGYIAQYLGDGLVIYFGYPKGHEDAPKAAVRCGLGLLQALAFANQQRSAENKKALNVRIGVHTGQVVVDYNLALGDTTNIAASLEGLAQTNSMLISQDTYKLVAGWFEAITKGIHQLKGITQPMEIFQVLHESGAKSRLEIAMHKGFSPLVGREEEIQLLERAWKQAKNKQGQIVLISGEAGIGKSRLLDSIKKEVAIEADAWLTEIHCLIHYQNTPFHPIIDLLEQVVLQFEPEDTMGHKMAKLEGFLLQAGFSLDQSIPIFADLLSLPLPAGYSVVNVTPSGRKKRIINAVLTALFARANQQPVLLIIEDLHWADASTLEWIDLLMYQLPTYAILAVTTSRPEFQAPWVGRSNMTQLTLQRLGTERIEAICLHQTNGKKLPLELLEQIKEKTDGIPLFVEELTRMVLESGMLLEQENHYEINGPLQSLKIPSTLKDSLISRLDNLNSVKELAQIGSVLGREFSFKLLQSVSGRTAQDLEKDLKQLINSELLYQRGLLPEANFIFKHALIQDTAYESLLKNRKKLLHQRVANVLEQEFPNLIQTKPEILAHHLTEAALFDTAILQWERAGQMAAQRFSTRESVYHLKKGLSLLNRLENPNFKIEKEADLLATLTPILQLSYGNSDNQDMTTRWLNAAKATQDIHKIHDAYIGQFNYLMFSTNYQESEPFGQEIIKLGQERNDHFMYANSLFFYGILKSLLGQHPASADYYNRALELYDPEIHLNKSYYHTGNIKANILTYGSITLHLLGQTDQALIDVQAAHQLVHQIKQPSSIYANAAFYSRLYLSRKEYDQVETIALPALKLAEENGDTFLIALLTYYLNTAYAHQGNLEAAHTAYKIMTKLYESYKAFRVAFLVFLADAFGKLGAVEKGLHIVTESLEHIEKTQEGLFVPELFRVQGDLLALQNPNAKEVENCYLKAMTIAAEQKDLWHELLAAKSLAKYLEQQGKTMEGYKLLQEVYQKFTEGFDTIDLKEAKEFLEEHSSFRT